MLQEERRKSGGGRREYSSASDSETEVRLVMNVSGWVVETSSRLVHHQHKTPTQPSWIARLYLGGTGQQRRRGLLPYNVVQPTTQSAVVPDRHALPVPQPTTSRRRRRRGARPLKRSPLKWLLQSSGTARGGMPRLHVSQACLGRCAALHAEFAPWACVLGPERPRSVQQRGLVPASPRNVLPTRSLPFPSH